MAVAPALFRTIAVLIDPGTARCAAPEWIDRVNGRLDAVMPLVERARAAVGAEVRFESLRIATTPVVHAAEGWSPADYLAVADAMDGMAVRHDAEFIGGFCGSTLGRRPAAILAAAFAEALLATDRVCGFLNVAQTGAGLDLHGLRACVDALRTMERRQPETRRLDAFAKFAVTANVVPASPFMPLAYREPGEDACSVSIGVGCLDRLIAAAEPGLPIDLAAERLTQAVRDEAVRADGVATAIEQHTGLQVVALDFSLVPRPHGPSSSVGHLLERLGASPTQTGALAVLSVLNNVIRRGALLGTTRGLALSRAFLSVSEDTVLDRAARDRRLTLQHLLALSAVCSVGLDMVALESSVEDDVLLSLIADQLAIGCAAGKASSARLILLPAGSVEGSFETRIFGTAVPLFPDEGSKAFARGSSAPFVYHPGDSATPLG